MKRLFLIVLAIPFSVFSQIQIGQDIDGEVLAIGGMRNDGNGENSGHVHVFDLSTLLSTEETNITQFDFFPNPSNNVLNIQLQQGTILDSLQQIQKM